MSIVTLNLEHGEAELAAGARSYVYRLLGQAFGFPDEALCCELLSGSWFGALQALVGYLPFPLAASPPPLVEADALQEAYISTFEVGTGKPFCPLYEGSHRAGRMKLMEDVVRFYEHFGLRAAAGDHPDHVSAELEFMHYLAFKQAAALARGDEGEELARAQHDFLKRHLCCWLPRVRARVAAVPDLPDFYRHLAALADDFCRLDLAFLKAGGGMFHPEVRRGPD